MARTKGRSIKDNPKDDPKDDHPRRGARGGIRDGIPPEEWGIIIEDDNIVVPRNWFKAGRRIGAVGIAVLCYLESLRCGYPAHLPPASEVGRALSISREEALRAMTRLVIQHLLVTDKEFDKFNLYVPVDPEIVPFFDLIDQVITKGEVKYEEIWPDRIING